MENDSSFYWDNFFKTGQISDYLQYVQQQNNPTSFLESNNNAYKDTGASDKTTQHR